MRRSRAGVVRLSTPADLLAAVPRLLGFTPQDSLVVICLHGPRHRVGLAMRFDLLPADDDKAFADVVCERVWTEQADAAFLAIYSVEPPRADRMPRTALIGAIVDRLELPLVDVVLTSGERWWPYDIAGRPSSDIAGAPVDGSSTGATTLAAAYALVGKAALPDRAAVVQSVALGLTDAAADSMRERIGTRIAQHGGSPRAARRQSVVVLARDLASRSGDPRGTISADDISELAALCTDVVVRDEILVRGGDPQWRRQLLSVLHGVVREVPPPFDPPVCSMLAWFAYADGDGVLANIAIDRALASDPAYSFARLIADALYNQVPPRLLEEVMRGAARDLRHSDAAG
jgi:hypothetical protein